VRIDNSGIRVFVVVRYRARNRDLGIILYIVLKCRSDEVIADQSDACDCSDYGGQGDLGDHGYHGD
jgi:hypothetical protein